MKNLIVSLTVGLLLLAGPVWGQSSRGPGGGLATGSVGTNHLNAQVYGLLLSESSLTNGNYGLWTLTDGVAVANATTALTNVTATSFAGQVGVSNLVDTTDRKSVV